MHCCLILKYILPQAGIFFREVLTDEQRTRLVENIAGHVKNASPFIQERVVSTLEYIHVIHSLYTVCTCITYNACVWCLFHLCVLCVRVLCVCE